jgi:hypothetical protein
MCIMPPDPISLCVCMCNLPNVTRQRLGKHVPAAMYTQATKTLLDKSTSMRSVSYEKEVCGFVYPIVAR